MGQLAANLWSIIMVAIRSIQEIASKWATVTPGRSADFEAGVRAPKKSWKSGSQAANQAWESGVQKAVQQKAFSKGVGASTDENWQAKTISKGVPRWGQGIALAEGDFASGFEPYRNAIAGVQLPPRFARRDPRNLDRVKAIVDALVKVKEGQR